VTAHDLAVALVDGALVELEAERSVINDLNVYPVPDGDTGTNLLLTVRAIREELERSAGSTDDGVAAAVTRGSLMGARGNSGVILSQIVRGACSVCRPGAALTTSTLTQAFAEATAAAYRAVKKPVEGTMLTVTREMSTAASRLPDDTSLADTLETILAAGRIAVERTTQQLAALRQAGVVDAGGYGLLVICRGLAAVLTGAHAGTSVAARQRSRAVGGPPLASPAEPSELSRYRYCTSFLLTGTAVPKDELENFLAPIGDSALLVGDADMLKVHVHTDDPGTVLSWAVRHGGISEVDINDMHVQTRERDARLRSAGGPLPRAGRTAVVAVVAGAGNQALFREVGCAGIVDGGQSMNPSAAQLLEVMDRLASDDVVVLPNNGNVILTAEQAATMSTRTIVVVPSKSMPAGLTAMVEFDPDKDAVANAAVMTQALARAHCAEITVAVRDSVIGDLSVKKDQVIGLIDGTLVATGEDVDGVLDDVLARLGAHDPEVVTVLTSLNGTSLTDDDIAAALARRLPQAEALIQAGGQPLYPILIGAE